MRKRLIAASILLILFTAILAGCASTGGAYTPATTISPSGMPLSSSEYTSTVSSSSTQKQGPFSIVVDGVTVTNVIPAEQIIDTDIIIVGTFPKSSFLGTVTCSDEPWNDYNVHRNE